MKFKLKLTRTETHEITEEIEADDLEQAKEIMQSKEDDGAFDDLDRVKDWKYLSGQTDSIDQVSEVERAMEFKKGDLVTYAPYEVEMPAVVVLAQIGMPPQPKKGDDRKFYSLVYLPKMPTKPFAISDEDWAREKEDHDLAVALHIKKALEGKIKLSTLALGRSIKESALFDLSEAE